MKGVKTIVSKELSRVFSDKKLVVSLYILPVVLIIALYSFIGKMQTNMMDNIEKHESKIYIQNQPEGFDDFIKSTGFLADVTYIGADADVESIKEKIIDGSVDLLVLFDEEFMDAISKYEQGNSIPEVRTFYNPSENYSESSRMSFVSTVLGSYKESLLEQRIGNLDNIAMFNVDLDEEASEIYNEDKAAGKTFGTILPYLITFMLFAGVMGLAIDAITGEKERGTMASMLLTPLKRRELVYGKILSLAILSSLSALVYGVGMIIAMPMMFKNMGVDEMEGMKLSFTSVQMAQLIIIMLVLVFFYVTIVSFISVLSRTAKEANTYVTPIYIIVLLAGMITMFTGGTTPDLPFYAIPVYGSAISIQDLLVGELTIAKFGLNIAGTIVLSIILAGCITKAFNSEKVMFNA